MTTILDIHQQSLLHYLQQVYQKNNNTLSFYDFMNIALYAPGLGYYSAGLPKIGPQGDFITAPEIFSLFSRSLAHFILNIFQHLPSQDRMIVELGAGTGKMAVDILRELAHHLALPQHYYILEVSAELKARQQHLIQSAIPEYYEKVKWISTLENFTFKGILLANEVIDALPVHLFQLNEAGDILEGRVRYREETWELIYDTPLTPKLQEAVTTLASQLSHPFSPGYSSEILLSLAAWLQSLASCLTQGVMLFIDYGFPQHEYYHPSRSMGTLMCHSRHQAHSDPMQRIGLQDITAHVDFTALATAGEKAGLSLAGFTSQAAFLLNNHLLTLAEPLFSDDLKNNFTLSQQIQTLTAPHEMGELFKVMAFSKNYPFSLQGFNWRDRHHLLR